MKRLIGMTDYVLEQDKTSNSMGESFFKCRNYANFLKQLLTIGMFIPTDENCNVLEEPNLDFDGTNQLYYEQYQQAKSKVIFEGFEWNTAEFCDEPMIELVDKKGNYLLYDCDDKNFQNAGDEFILTIEDLIPYNLTLTDNVKI